MKFSLPLYIGYRYWRAKKHNSFASFITIFAVSGIFLGVAALILVSSVMNGLEGQLKARILGAIPQLTITSSSSSQTESSQSTSLHGLNNYPEFKQALLQLPDVEGVAATVSTQAMLQSSTNIRAVELYGVYPKEVAQLSNVAKNTFSGRFDSLQAGDYKVILGADLARSLGVVPGERIRILSGDGVVYTPLGPVPSQRKFTVSGLFEMGSQVDEAVAYIQYQDAKRLMRLPSGQVNQWRLYLTDPFDAPMLAPQIEQIANKMNIKVKVSDWRANYGHLFSAVKMEKNMMSLMLSLIVAVAAFNIVSALVMMVVDKTSNVAVLKTQGLSTSQIMGIFMVQGSMNALLGLIFGVAAGVLLTLNLNGILNELGISVLSVGQKLPVKIEIAQLSWIIVGTLAITFAATLYPALKAAKVRPAVVLRHE